MIQKQDEEAENGCWIIIVEGSQVEKPDSAAAVASLTAPFPKDILRGPAISSTYLSQETLRMGFDDASKKSRVLP